MVASGAIRPRRPKSWVRCCVPGCRFLIIGGTGSGKTTLLGALIGQMGAAERVLCVEDALLTPTHPHVVRLVARTANVEGAGEVAVRVLVRQALRMRPDRILGEVGVRVIDLRPPEHRSRRRRHPARPARPPRCPRADGGARRLGWDGPRRLHSQLAAAVHIVLGVAHNVDGTRGLSEIGVLRRGADGLVTVVPIWLRSVSSLRTERFRRDGRDPMTAILLASACAVLWSGAPRTAHRLRPLGGRHTTGVRRTTDRRADRDLRCAAGRRYRCGGRCGTRGRRVRMAGSSPPGRRAGRRATR